MRTMLGLMNKMIIKSDYYYYEGIDLSYFLLLNFNFIKLYF